MLLKRPESRRLFLILFCAFAVTSCGNQGTTSSAATKKTTSTLTGSAVGTVGSTSGSSGSSPITNVGLGAPLEFGVFGMGNHPQHVCVPAASKLVLRIIPRANTAPLMSYNPFLINANNGQPLYDGSPAFYNKLRVRLSIPGSAAAWDFEANLETPSAKGDFSAHLRAVAATPLTETPMLSVPEYGDDKTIYGSNPRDGLCTHWEKELGRCATVSSILRSSESVACPAGQQKILVSKIASDYPCHNDAVGWCQSGQMQSVPDYQQWTFTLQAATEATKSL